MDVKVRNGLASGLAVLKADSDSISLKDFFESSRDLLNAQEKRSNDLRWDLGKPVVWCAWDDQDMSWDDGLEVDDRATRRVGRTVEDLVGHIERCELDLAVLSAPSFGILAALLGSRNSGCRRW